MAFQGYEKGRAKKSWRSINFALKSLAAVSALLLCGYGSSYVDRDLAAALAKKMGKPEQLLLGLSTHDIAGIKTQKMGVDILDHYLVGVGESSWASWNSPRGEYIRVFTEQADSIGAVPMFTLYQMGNGSAADANLAGLTDRIFMTQYWDNVKLLFLKLGQYDSPVMVNLEPDFWGHAQKRALNDDPNTLGALVSINPDCADLPDSVVGVAACQMRIARQYAPRALLGFPVSDWGGRSSADVAQFMKKLGAEQADFLVLQSPDQRIASANSPYFENCLGKIRFYHESMGRLPVLLWRASLGVSAVDPAETSKEKPEDSAHYFLKHADKLVAAGGMGIVFSVGETHQSDIAADAGQFRFLSLWHAMNPTPL